MEREKQVKAKDPIHFYDGKWWFWDEIWTDRIGPYETRGQAEEAITEYCKYLSCQHQGLA